MAYGQKLAARAEAERQRLISTDKSETPEDGTEASSSPAPAAVPATVPAPRQGFRPTGFRPNRGVSQDQVQGQAARPAFGGLPVEDGIPAVQVVRRLLEIAAIERWPQSRVDNIERLAHEDPAAAWEQVSPAWEELSSRRRVAAGPRDSAQVSFRIVGQDGQARPSTPTGARAAAMTLLHGLDLVRLPTTHAPFSPAIVAGVQAEQRRLRQAAAQQPADPAAEIEKAPPVSQEPEVQVPAPAEESAPSGRWVRQVRR